MNAQTPFAPTRAAALARIQALQPDAYAHSRNFIEGTVSGLSPYITHALVSLSEVLSDVTARHPLAAQHPFVFELGWRAYFRHVWAHRGDGIFRSLHAGPLPETAYATQLPVDIRQGATGVPVIDVAVRTLYATGYLHNHARLWLASYIVHVRKVHWRVAADWLYVHLLDGDLASNHLSWQWVAGTGSHKPYLFNADNVARFAPAAWHSPGSVIDRSYEALDRMAREPLCDDTALKTACAAPAPCSEPGLSASPPSDLGWSAPDAAAVAGRDVWLVHPWNLGALPATLPASTVVVALFLSDFHRAWPWSEHRWRFVAHRMSELVTCRWHGDAAAIGAALSGARRVQTTEDPHLGAWLSRWAECAPAPALFPAVDKACDSFSKWWKQALRGTHMARDLLTQPPTAQV